MEERRENKKKDQTVDWNASVVDIIIYSQSPVSIWIYTIYSSNYNSLYKIHNNETQEGTDMEAWITSEHHAKVSLQQLYSGLWINAKAQIRWQDKDQLAIFVLDT